MSTFRVKKRENPFVQIDKTCLNDENLSWKAKGILAYLLSLPDDWRVYEQEINTHSSDGIKSTRSGIKELITNGYIKRVQLREDGKFKGYEYQIFEIPTEVPKTENGNIADMTKGQNDKRQDEEGQNEKRHTTNNNLTDNDNTDNNRTEKEAAFSSDNMDKFFSSIKAEMLDLNLEIGFNSFIKNLNIIQTENKITIIAPNNFAKEMIERKFLILIEIHLRKYFEFEKMEVLSKEEAQVI